MTFDEAENLLLEQNLDDEVASLVVYEMSVLNDTYAPTVEMTKRQFHSFKLWKHHTAGWNMTNCAEWARDEKITASNAMRAWLHPETIKIVNE